MKKARFTPSSMRYLGFMALVGAVTVAAGCSRRDRDGLPAGPPSPEMPITPRIDPARPAAEATGEARTDDGQSPSTPSAGTAPSAGATPTTSGDPREAKARFETAPGYSVSGDAELEEGSTGVKFVVEIEDAPAGKKGIHVHEKGDCSDIPGKSMGEHFGPNAKGHGLPPDPSRHLGDLGNIEVKKDGAARLEVEVRNANLKAKDPMSLLGRALVIHEAEDRGSQPSGGAGKPIACAVIVED